MSERLREYAEAIVGTVDKIDDDGMISYARDTSRFGFGLKESYELAVAYLAEHPETQPITAAWLREQEWRFLQDKWWLDINEENTLRLSEHSGVWRACLTTHVAIIPLRHVTDTADLASLVAALRGGGA